MFEWLKKIASLLEEIITLLKGVLKQKEEPETAKVETIEEMIRRIAKEYNVNDDLAVKVARCESSLDPEARNVNPKGSVDRGLYQWNSKWHPEVSDACAYDPECATRKFCEAVKEGHLNWWNASRSCWSK